MTSNIEYRQLYPVLLALVRWLRRGRGSIRHRNTIFRVVVGCERLVNRVRLHVESAARAVEETAHREQPILGSAGDEIERRSPAEDDGFMRGQCGAMAPAGSRSDGLRYLRARCLSGKPLDG
jgi:hypothetical protein